MSEIENKVEELATEVSEANGQDAPTKNSVKGEPMKKVDGAGYEDIGGETTDNPDGKIDNSKKVKKDATAPTKGAGSAETAPVAQGSSKIKEPLAAGDNVEHEGDDIAEAEHDGKKEGMHEMPKTKAGMIQAMYDKMKEMKKDDMAKEYKHIMAKLDMKAGYHEGMHDKEDEEEKKKEEASKKEAIEKRVKDIDVKEDVNALVSGESELSEEFKTKAATVFEAAVKSKVKAEIERLEDNYASELEESKSSMKEDMVQKVDNYLNYVVEEWVKDNELAIERGIKGEIAEDFIGGLKQLFEDHYIDIPDEKYDILEAQAKEIDELKAKVNSEVEKNVSLKKENADLTRGDIFEEVSETMADTQKEKFKGLTENVDFEDADDYKKKLETIKESYFASEAKPAETNVDTTSSNSGTVDPSDLSDTMAKYTAAITRTKNIKINKGE
jgi:regulator of replication initiation timing